jgi:hypothetical protein
VECSKVNHENDQKKNQETAPDFESMKKHRKNEHRKPGSLGDNAGIVLKKQRWKNHGILLLGF